MKSAIVLTNGCPENRIDSAQMQQFLQSSGWQIVHNNKEADLILFNTCGLTELSQRESIEIINKIKMEKTEKSMFLVGGCLPQINESLLRKFFKGTVIANHNITSFKNLIGSTADEKKINANYLIPKFTLSKSLYERVTFFINSIFENPQRLLIRPLIFPYRRLLKNNNLFGQKTFVIKVSTGCLNSCSFCAVKISRGHLVSKSIYEVVREFKLGLQNGYNDFALIGTDVGSYGADIGTNLSSLLEEITRIEGSYKIKLRNVHPGFLIKLLPELVRVLSSGRISHIESAVESGSDRIIKLMNRCYKIDDYVKTIQFLNKVFPMIKLHTQILVGFPGESDDDFNATLCLLDQLKFDFIEFYIYSPRPNTKAELLEYKAQKKIVDNRYDKLVSRYLFNKVKYFLK